MITREKLEADRKAWLAAFTALTSMIPDYDPRRVYEGPLEAAISAVAHGHGVAWRAVRDFDLEQAGRAA